jgi:hypothetical protein
MEKLLMLMSLPTLLAIATMIVLERPGADERPPPVPVRRNRYRHEPR